MAKYKVMGMNTGFGNKEFTLMMNDGEKYVSSRPAKYFKTLSGAKRYAQKRGFSLEK